MATHINYDLDLRVIYVITAPTDGTLELDVQKDIYSAAKKDWKDLGITTLLGLKFPFRDPSGGREIVAGEVYETPRYFLDANWRMRPYEGDHTLYLKNAYLQLSGGGDPWLPAIGAYTINIRDVVPADSVTSASQGGLTFGQYYAAKYA